jgi:hypothetical protein
MSRPDPDRDGVEVILDRLAELDAKLDRLLAGPSNRRPIDPRCPQDRCTRERGHVGFHHVGFEEGAT